MTTEESAPPPELRHHVPVSWEALEDAFENNAHEVHSYLHLETGEVIRVVDGVADPAMHQRIMHDAAYLRIEPVSSREQYRWMERFIATVDEPDLRQRLLQSIDGKGAFRRFKDVLMSFPADRERWFSFRSERLRACMTGWLEAHGVGVVARPDRPVVVSEEPEAGLEEVELARKARAAAAEGLRGRLRTLADTTAPRDLEVAIAFLEFLRTNRAPMPPRGEGDGDPS